MGKIRLLKIRLPKGASMRGIAFVLALAMLVAGFAVAIADQSVAPAPIRLAVFPFESLTDAAVCG